MGASFPRCLLLLAALLIGDGARAETSPPLAFGVLNQQSPLLTAEKWNPILSYLTRKTGIPLRLKMGTTVEATDAMMGREEFDLVFTNHNFQTEYDGKYRVVARWAGKPIHGVVAVHEDSPLKRLDDLNGHVVAFPSPDAFVAYAVPVAAFRTRNIVVKEKFAGNQDGAMAQLKARVVDAAALNSRFLDDYARRENARFRTLHVSEPFMELPVVVHPRVRADHVQALQKAMLGMRDDPAAAELLQHIRGQGFEPATDADYDVVRRIYKAIGQ